MSDRSNLTLSTCLLLLALPCTAALATEPAAVDPATSAAAGIEAPELSTEERAAAQFYVMSGELAAGRGQPAIAARQFLEALKLIQDADLAQRATVLALTSRDLGMTLEGARVWLKLAPNEMEPREIIARISLAKGDTAETLAQCKAITSGHAGGVSEGLRIASQLLAQSPAAQMKDAMTVMRELAAAWPQESEGQHGIGLVALGNQQPADAEAAARAALALKPGARNHLILLGATLIKQNKQEGAESIFDALAKRDPEPADVRLMYAKLLLESDKRDLARIQLRKGLNAQPDNTDIRYALGILAINDRQYDEAASLLETLLEDERGTEAAFQMGRVEEGRKDFPKALAYYERAIGGMQGLEAAIRRGYVLAQMKKVEQARTLMASLRQQLPQYETRFWLAEGDFLSLADADDDALAVYDEALKKFPDDSNLLYGRSLIHERKKRIDLAEKDLRAILSRDPKEARSLNALGYMLTVHTKRYEEARTLITQALALEPDDAAILDSLGWVQFKLGQEEEARKLLTRAHEKFPDPEVAAHLGEVLWTLGQKTEAREIWDQALRDDPGHRGLNETIQRLTR